MEIRQLCFINFKCQNNINLYEKFKAQLNLTYIFAKYAYWQATPVKPELGTAQPSLFVYFSLYMPLLEILWTGGHYLDFNVSPDKVLSKSNIPL
jgi:hypothetical protein